MIGHIQHLSFESLVKIDHFQKKPPPNLNIRFGSLADILAINRDGCFTSKADIHERDRHVRYGPIADITSPHGVVN